MKGECTLLIPDSIAQPKGAYISNTDAVIADAGLTQLVMRGRQKPGLDQIALPQYLSSNCQILLQLMEQGKIRDHGVPEYLEYTVEVGDLRQTNTTSFVILLDNAHRLRQAKRKSSWLDSDPHLRDFCLKQRQKPTISEKDGNRVNISTSCSSPEICRSYNQVGDCHFTNSKCSHICQVQGCSGSHPRHQSASTPTSFSWPQSFQPCHF